MWEVELAAGSASPRHRLDREEVFLGSAGEAVATMAADEVGQQLAQLLLGAVHRRDRLARRIEEDLLAVEPVPRARAARRQLDLPPAGLGRTITE